MEQATEFPCCLWDRLDNVQLGDDGLPLAITRDNISTWFEWNGIPMPENSDSLSDAELILKFADPLKAKSCFQVISYADALYFSHKDALESGQTSWAILKDLNWTNGCFSHYPPEIRKILKEFAISQTKTLAATLFRKAIKERDEEIARKEAERKAEEEARQEAYEKLKGFLESIGDFVIFDAGVLTPIKDLWIKSDGDILLLGNRGRDPFQLSLVNGFDQNLQKIIKWAVDNGAREPETKTVAA